MNITRTHIQSVCVHHHCKQRFTHPSGEGRFITHKSLPGFVDSASANVCLVFLRLSTPPSLLHLVTPSTTRPNPFPPSKVRCTTHITYSFRIVSSFGFVALLSTVQALRSLTNLVPELCFLNGICVPLPSVKLFLSSRRAFHTISCSRNSLHCTSTSCLHFQPDEESCTACL